MFKWFLYRVLESKKQRQDNPSFFIKPFIDTKPWESIEKMMSLIPAVILDGENRLYSYAVKEKDIVEQAALYFNAMHHVVLSHLVNTDIKCPIYEACSFNKMKNQECLEAPWKKTNLNQTCNLGSAFAALGVRDKIVDYQAFHKKGE